VASSCEYVDEHLGNLQAEQLFASQEEFLNIIVGTAHIE
jgi:hypothetical protein